MEHKLKNFTFGLETEYVVVESPTFRPLWHTELTFPQVYDLLDRIPLDGLPSLEGLELEPPHRKLMPYVVEGYHLPDPEFKPKDLLPKGIEIRTPVCASIGESLAVLADLHGRLRRELTVAGLDCIALSHHPVAHHFRGPQNKRRHDYWLWSMEVMTTYGPDVNIGLPDELMRRLDVEDFGAKLNYYTPAMTAFSVGAPFRAGAPWTVRGHVGKSLRTYRRSIVGPPIEIHPEENNRLEFKTFDMSPNLADYDAYFLLCLTVLLDEQLAGRASNATRIYDLGQVAVHGFAPETVRERAAELLESAERCLPAWGFETSSFREFARRLEQNETPADRLLREYEDSGSDLTPVLRGLAPLKGGHAAERTRPDLGLAVHSL
jgi:hypothetical protein